MLCVWFIVRCGMVFAMYCLMLHDMCVLAWMCFGCDVVCVVVCVFFVCVFCWGFVCAFECVLVVRCLCVFCL